MQRVSLIAGRPEIQRVVVKAVDEGRLPPSAGDCFAEVRGDDLKTFQKDADRLMSMKESEGKNQEWNLAGSVESANPRVLGTLIRECPGSLVVVG